MYLQRWRIISYFETRVVELDIRLDIMLAIALAIALASTEFTFFV